MAEAEQPLKKQKLYALPPPQPPPPPPPPPPQPPPPPSTPPPLSPEEILQRRRSKEEIRNVFECYKRIKLCIERNDKREIEEAYLCLIAATRGGASVQRLLAEYIPRYASCCPTALEAATKVVINMHNWWFTVINKGGDGGGVAFEIAKACIFGLVDICQAAASEAPTSAVIQGICSAVFLNVFMFFISSFDGQDIFQIVDQRILKIHDVSESFCEFKREFLEENKSMLLKLSKFRALCFLRIFFNHPKNSTAGCFELLESTRTEESRIGRYFFHQLTTELNDFGVDYVDEGRDGNKSVIGSIKAKCEHKHLNDDYFASHGIPFTNSKLIVLKNCLLGLVFCKDPSFRSWIFSRCRKLCNSSSEVVTHVTSVLEGVFESFVQRLTEEGSQVDEDEDTSSSSKYVSQYLVSRISSQQGSPSAASGRDCSDKGCSTHLKNGSFKSSIDPIDSGETKSMDFHHGDSVDALNARNFSPREFLNRQNFSPRARTPREFRSNSFTGRVHSAQIEKSPIPNLDFPATALRSSTGSSNSPFESPKHDIPASHSSVNLATRYSDGDSAAMDVFPASKQLWLGSLGPDASDIHIRFLFEKFGPIDQLQYFPFKGYALIEYRNLMDAIKVREVMRGRSPWGACLQIKFIDTGLGTRGAVNGIAIGSSCHIYVGHAPSKWAKEQIIHEVKQVLHKGPRVVIDLSSEGALLMEFDSPKEATVAMAHLRWHRKENGNFVFPPSVCPSNLMVNVEGARPGSVPADPRSNFPLNNMVGSPHTQGVLDKPYDSYMTRTSGNSGKHHGASPPVRPDVSALELTSPRTSQENFRPMMQNVHPFQSTWTDAGMLEGGRTGTTNQTWMYGKLGTGAPSGQGSLGPMPTQTQGPPIPPQQPGQAPTFVRPVYAPPNSLWDARGMGHHMPPNPIPCVTPAHAHHGSVQAPPFLPASVTPLAKIQGSSLPPLDQMYSLPAVPPPLSCLPPTNMPPVPPQPDFRPSLPPQPDFRPPLPPQPDFRPPLPPQLDFRPPLPQPEFQPPLPQPELQPPFFPPPPPPPPPPSHPPAPPPLPSSPPPPPPRPPLPQSGSASAEGSRSRQKYTWQGILSKSGVYYCTMVAEKVDSDSCNYSSDVAEPLEWPAKLDMTKRTDFRHVKSTFSSTPPHRKEVCWLFPSCQEDHKGFQDFISYMKQRDCAGVIKIPAAKSMWARLLFILPYSPETCAMLTIPPNPSLCLIGLVVPKETNAESV